MITGTFKRSVNILVIATTVAITGCGGGGGSSNSTGTDPKNPNTSVPSPKGFWTGTQGASSLSAIVLANGDSWIISDDAGTINFARIQTTATGNSFGGTGTRYLLQSGTVEPVTASGTFVEKTTLSGSMSPVSNSFILAYNTRYETIASLTDAAGSWLGSYGSSTLTLNVASTGSLSGNSTTGCKYSGTLMTRSSDPAVFDVNFIETCGVNANPAVKALSGIATINAAKTAISIATSTADKASGALFVGVKQ